MGVDICLAVERRTPQGTWERVEPLVHNPYPSDDPDDDRPPNLRGEFIREEWYTTRNRWVFAVLAGAGYWFETAPISLPRGLPADVSLETREYIEYGAEHEVSFLTLQELEAYDWEQPGPNGNKGYDYRLSGEAAGDFYEEFLPRLRQLGDPNNIRIVFGFNS